MNLGNKYAKSYSSSNPPPRPGDKPDNETRPAPPSFMDELGMDKEPSRKERKKKLQKIADDPGILVDAAARGDVSEIRELVVDYEVPVDQPRVGGDGVTPLQAATLKNQPDAVKALLKLGADT
jgi:ankyrin repeat protein